MSYDILRERSYPTPYQNSTLLPLLLFSLATQKHTPDPSKSFKTEYDYIVVGGGSAGAVVASRLSEIPCVSVLLLEAGDTPPLLTEIPAIPTSFFMTDMDWQFMTEPQRYTGAGLKNRQIPWPGGKTLGGSGCHNGMVYIRGNRKDYDKWERSGARGWSWKDVFPYFLKLENNTDPDIAHNGYHNVGGPVTVGRTSYRSPINEAVIRGMLSLGYPIVDTNGANQIGINDLQRNIRDGQRCSAAKSHLVPSENRPNIDIITGAFVTKIVINGKKAVGVLFDKGGFQYEVRSRKEVILSAGTVQSAQLLMLSGIGPKKILQGLNIPIVADLPVGENFQDHGAAMVNFVVKDPPISTFPKELVKPENIILYAAEKIGPLTGDTSIMAFLHTNRWEQADAPPHVQIYMGSGSPHSAKSQIGFKPWVYQAFFGPYENSTILFCAPTILQPKSRGYVSIRSANPYYPPIIDPNYFEDPEDMYNMVIGMKACKRIVETEALQKLNVQPFETVMPGCEAFVNHENKYLKCLARSFVFTFSHPVGTAKMGDPNDPSTVVDPELSVKGIKGLRVVDASVMPFVTSGNTNFPTMMIAEKASDIIKGSIECF